MEEGVSGDAYARHPSFASFPSFDAHRRQRRRRKEGDYEGSEVEVFFRPLPPCKFIACAFDMMMLAVGGGRGGSIKRRGMTAARHGK